MAGEVCEYLLRMLLQEMHADSAADALQAERWCEWLLSERSELALRLSKNKRHYDQCVASVGPRRLGCLCGAIRELEYEIRTIDRMNDALTR